MGLDTISAVFARSQFPSWYNGHAPDAYAVNVFARSQFPSWYNTDEELEELREVFARSQFPSWYNDGVLQLHYLVVFARSQFPSWYNCKRIVEKTHDSLRAVSIPQLVQCLDPVYLV